MKRVRCAEPPEAICKVKASKQGVEDLLTEACLSDQTPNRAPLQNGALQASNLEDESDASCSAPTPETGRHAQEQDAGSQRETGVRVPEECDSKALQQTPELCTCAIGSDARDAEDAARTVAPLFSLFRPRAQRKILVIIRHAESQYNAAVRSNTGWSDPTIPDPCLTEKGCRQARLLQRQLRAELKDNLALSSGQHALWITSPLRRCIQTLLLSCPLLPDSPGPAMGSATQQVQERLRGVQQTQLPAIKVTGLIAERLLTFGDIGTSVSQLKCEFPALEDCFEMESDLWWHCADKNSHTSESFGEKEGQMNWKSRISQARQWLERQPARVLFLYGHSVFWKAFFGQDETMLNGEYRLLHW